MDLKSTITLFYQIPIIKCFKACSISFFYIPKCAIMFLKKWVTFPKMGYKMGYFLHQNRH
ncbi:hypothetical protein DST39_02670 [Campylobacter jejuni]|nr:hypothetical protein [Campylobacter jejuni]